VLVTAADELEQQVGMAIGIGEISDFVDHQKTRAGIVTQAAAQGGIAVERGEVAAQLTGAAGHDRFDHQDAGRVLGNFMLAGADGLNMTRLALSLSGYVNGVPRKHAQTAQGMFPDHQVHAITNFYCHPGRAGGPKSLLSSCRLPEHPRACSRRLWCMPSEERGAAVIAGVLRNQKRFIESGIVYNNRVIPNLPSDHFASEPGPPRRFCMKYGRDPVEEVKHHLRSIAEAI